eukprot:COSAG01_NODE_992_length_12250_cov_14.174356_5_plen_366_part_00
MILIPCEQQQRHDDDAVVFVTAAPVAQATLTSHGTTPAPLIASPAARTAAEWLRPGAGVIPGASPYMCAPDREAFEQGPQAALIGSGRWRLPSFAETHCDAAVIVGRVVFVAGFGQGIVTAKITRCISSNTNAVTFEAGITRRSNVDIMLARKGNRGVQWLVMVGSSTAEANRQTQEHQLLRAEYIRLGGSARSVPSAGAAAERAHFIKHITRRRTAKKTQACLLPPTIGAALAPAILLAPLSVVGGLAGVVTAMVAGEVTSVRRQREALEDATDNVAPAAVLPLPLTSGCTTKYADDSDTAGKAMDVPSSTSPQPCPLDGENQIERETFGALRQQWREDNPQLVEEFQTWLPLRTTVGAAALRS